MHAREWWEAIRQDVSYAVRGLRREPLFALFVVVTLGLGIGANAAMFGVVDKLLLRGPDHIVDSKNVMRLYLHERVAGEGDFSGNAFGYVMYDVLKHNAHSFSGIGAYAASVHQQTIMGHGENAQQIWQGQATADLFSMLGVKPVIGRFFTSAEDSTGAPQRVAVIGYGLWQRAFGGDVHVVGTTVLLRDIPYTIVGVAPKGFTGPQYSPVDVWVPVALHPTMNADDLFRSWHVQWLEIAVRLKPGVTLAQAAADATSAYQHAYTGGDKEDAAADLFVAPLSYNDDGKESADVSVSRWLVGVAAIVLLIACSNVVNLLLARAVRRRREVAVRLALGAGRLRLVQLMLTESMLLAVLAGAAGVAVAWVTGGVVRTVLLTGIEWSSPPVDVRMLAVSALIALAVGVVIGVVPAIRASRADLGSALKSGVREGGARGMRLRAGLTVAQAALSVVLLAGAGFFVRSLARVRAMDLGIQPDRMLLVQPRWPGISATDSAQRAAETRRREAIPVEALERVRQMPGVERATVAIGLPFRSSYSQFVRVDGLDSIPKLPGGYPQISAVASDYFATAGTKLIRGRLFTAADRAGSERVTIVSEHMAKVLWPGRDPIGECLYAGERRELVKDCTRVVGIVADVHRFRLQEATGMHYYVPLGQETGIGGTALVIRPRADAPNVAQDLRRLMQQLDPTISFVNTTLLQTDIDPQLKPWQLGASVFGMMGVLALIVAAVGLYSVMSYLVAQRTHELGVRIALGAQGTDIASLVLKSSTGMALVGVVIGIGISLAAGRYIEPLLFETSARDSGVLGSVSALLLGVAILASLLPALRASRTNPLEALRTE